MSPTEMVSSPDAVVVGLGVVGLTAALALQATGRHVVIVSADELGATTSNLAAAVWFPTAVGHDDRVLSWSTRSYERLQSAADDPGSGVIMRDTLMLYPSPPGRPWWAPSVPGLREARPEELPAGHRFGLAFSAPLAEMPPHLRWLHRRFVAGGGEVRRRRIGTLEELDGLAPLVVNCAGLGARELVEDATVTPIRGQVVRTTNPGLQVSIRDQHHPDGYTYIHPRRDDCILGGTVEPGREDTTVDGEVTAAILARCRALVPALSEAEVLGSVVGLRPGRPSVRLERDDASLDVSTVIHDYGHGGAGVTLAWGCAEEVVRLADRAGTVRACTP